MRVLPIVIITLAAILAIVYIRRGATISRGFGRFVWALVVRLSQLAVHAALWLLIFSPVWGLAVFITWLIPTIVVANTLRCRLWTVLFLYIDFSILVFFWPLVALGAIFSRLKEAVSKLVILPLGLGSLFHILWLLLLLGPYLVRGSNLTLLAGAVGFLMAAWMATLQFSQGGRSKLVISLICLLFVPLAICWGVYIKQSGAQLSILGWASWSVAILTASLIFTRIMGGRWKEATPILIPLIALGVIVGGAAKLTNIISSGSWSLSPANTAILIGSLSAAFIIGCLIFIAARGEQVVVVTTTGGDDEEEKEE